MAIRDIVKQVAPELTVDADIDAFSALAALSVNRNWFGDKSDLATALLTAHMMTMRGRGAVSGPVSAEEVGEIKLAYASTSKADDNGDLKLSSYGSQFLALRRTVGPAMFTT